MLTLNVCNQNDPMYKKIYKFAQFVYWERLRAKLSSRPEIFSFAQDGEDIIGCVGLHCGAMKNPLMLETYFNFNVLEFLSNGRLKDRKYFGELGTRAVKKCRISNTLISVGLMAILALQSYELKIEYLVFTVDRSFRTITDQIGAKLISIGKPDLSEKDQVFLENWKFFFKVPRQCLGFSTKQALPGCKKRLQTLEENQEFQLYPALKMWL